MSNTNETNWKQSYEDLLNHIWEHFVVREDDKANINFNAQLIAETLESLQKNDFWSQAQLKDNVTYYLPKDSYVWDYLETSSRWKDIFKK